MKIRRNRAPGWQSLNAGPKQPDFQFERPDWSLFRSVETLPQKAGVPQSCLRRLALKELVDNALDVSPATVSADPLDGTFDRFFVQDDGPGMAGGPDAIARQFSINRPLISTKLWRLPTRGALGNGLRVVMGTVAASSGSLVVMTRNQRIELAPQEDGSTAATATPIDFPLGTRIEITFGPALPRDPHALEWARLAIVLEPRRRRLHRPILPVLVQRRRLP